MADYGGGLDVILFLSMAGYGLTYLRSLRHGPSQFPLAARKAFRWLYAFAVFYLFSAALDLIIALELLGAANIEKSVLLPVAVLLLFAASIVLVFGAMGRRPLFDWLQEVAAARSTHTIPDDVLDDIAARIRVAAAEKRVYADEDMSLTRFARRLGEPSRSVSKAINSRMGMSFSDLMNCVRVEAAMHLLRDTEAQDRSITDVAYEVGFSSKSNFHRVFKDKEGMTPAQFRALPGSRRGG